MINSDFDLAVNCVLKVHEAVTSKNKISFYTFLKQPPYPDKGESFCPRKCVIYSCVYESSTYKTFPKRHCVNIVSRHKCISQQWRQVSKIKKKSLKSIEPLLLL